MGPLCSARPFHRKARAQPGLLGAVLLLKVSLRWGPRAAFLSFPGVFVLPGP